MSYKKYDPWVKQMIAESRNVNFFPELAIPRTTAIYWINNAKVAGAFLQFKGRFFCKFGKFVLSSR